MSASRTVAAGIAFLLCSCATKSPQAGASTGPGAKEAVAATGGPASPEVRARVEALLKEEQTLPEAWKALGPTALGPVTDAAKDTQRPLDVRTRAVGALAYVANPGADATLQTLLQDAAADAKLRGAAMRSLAQRQGPQAVTQLTPLLTQENPDLRTSAAGALGLAGGEEARKSLEARLAEEENVGVREALQQNLSKVQP